MRKRHFALLASLSMVGPRTAVWAQTPAIPDCPRCETVVTRNARLVVRYEGESEPGVCQEIVGGQPRAEVAGIWPAAWPEASKAADAMRHVLARATGASESFSATFDVIGTSFTTSGTLRFTVTNLGPAVVTIGGRDHAAVRIGWDELSLGHAYNAQGEMLKDVATGVILKRKFSLLYGSSQAASEYWPKYGGGLGAEVDYLVTGFQ